MNKKIIVVLSLSLVLGAFNPAIAMHGKIFRGVQIATSGAIIGLSGKMAYGLNEELKKPIALDSASTKVTTFVHEGLVRLNVPNATKVPVVVVDSSGPSWICLSDKAIGVNHQIAAAIESGDEIAIKEGQVVEKHETKHLLNKDSQKRVYAQIASPCVVQAVGSGLTYGFNKVVKRKQPKTIVSLAGRSLVAVGAIGPKAIMSGFGIIAYVRYQEAQADQFACEHADSREELEVFKRFWDKKTEQNEQVMLQQPLYFAADEKTRNRIMRIEYFLVDKEHPLPADRAAMVQNYIDKWDAEHKA